MQIHFATPVSPVESPAPTKEKRPLARKPLSTVATARDPRFRRFLHHPLTALSALTFLALLIQGYHPYADDGAIYVAGIEKVVDPSLFPVHDAYVLPHLQHSLFSYAIGWLIRASHVPLSYALFATYLLSIWLTLYACYRLAARLFPDRRNCWGAVALLAVTLTLPVAGTAIFFCDPYLTARSLCTPATLFALEFALRRRFLLSAAFLLVAFLLHPLMAAYAIGFVITLALVQARRWQWLGGLALAALALGFAASHAGALLGGSPAYRMATATRSYFFLDQWQWFELFGLFPPLAAALIYWSRREFKVRSHACLLAATCLYTGGLAVVFALCFTRTSVSFLLARLQPLRVFQLIYILFFLALGGLLARYLLRRRWWAWATCFSAIAAVMFIAQIRTYPSLQHIEWPWAAPENPWEQAYSWIRANTPKDAYFAMDPHYQSLPHEDTVGFRAATERSVLPDWNKDGGVAAIDPALAPQWWMEVTATKDFLHWTDVQRQRNLGTLGVDWIVLPTSVSTHLVCPYRNSAVQVCQLHRQQR